MKALVLSIALTTTQAAAQSSTGATLAGRVTDAATSAPLAQATVTVEGTTLLATTAADGRYRLSELPPGPQVIRFIRIGYAPVRQSMAVPSTGLLTHDVAMAKRIGFVLTVPASK